MVMFCENLQLNSAFIHFCLSHVWKPLSHPGATMRQLDIPVKTYPALDYKGTLSDATISFSQSQGWDETPLKSGIENVWLQGKHFQHYMVIP